MEKDTGGGKHAGHPPAGQPPGGAPARARHRGKACVQQTELATKACLEGKDAETCRWMCNYARDGKDLYCARHKELDPAAAAE